MTWIETYSGKKFDILKPTFCIEDIAHGLSNLSRWNGQCSKFYSVAEHSLAVAELMALEGGDPLEGLLHDGHEAYLSDVPSPFKSVLPDWKALEDSCEAELRRVFGLPLQKTKACHRADTMMLFCEAHYLLPNKGRNFTDPLKIRFEAETIYKQYMPLNMVPSEAKAAFLAEYKRLTEARKSVKC